MRSIIAVSSVALLVVGCTWAKPVNGPDGEPGWYLIKCQSLANGKSETWVADRSGQRSSEMINRYQRAARTWAEVDLGQLAPLDEAIPELRAEAPAASLPREMPHANREHPPSEAG